MTIANKFTLSRFLFAPVLFLLYFFPLWTHLGLSFCRIIVIPLLAAAELTDYFDGFFARKNHEVSDFGKLFDPFADVILHMTAFICLAYSGYVNICVLVLVFFREYSMNFLRMVASKQGVAIAARKGGKLKTVIYVCTIFFFVLFDSLKVVFPFIMNDFVNQLFFGVGILLQVLCVIFSYASFIDYLKHFGSILKSVI